METEAVNTEATVAPQDQDQVVEQTVPKALAHKIQILLAIIKLIILATPKGQARPPSGKPPPVQTV
jgi:hypothetical protein